MNSKNTYIRWFENLGNQDVGIVGGKNASLGEMIAALKEEKVRIPDGFATTADVYRQFVSENDLEPKIRSLLDELESDADRLAEVGKKIRQFFTKAQFPQDAADAIAAAYQELSKRYDAQQVDVAVRSSATAEDLPEASFAGQQESFLNITGESDLLDACRRCFASLFTDRAISYRREKGFDHMKVALSVGVQKMVRADRAGAGVMFSIDTETGFPDIVMINAAFGLGENVVQGTVNPDEYRVFKPLLANGQLTPIIDKSLGTKEKKMVYARGGSRATQNKDTPKSERRQFVLQDSEILQLARWAASIEKHYEIAMDMEWAKDGDTGDLYIVQARPETVQSRKKKGELSSYHLKEEGDVLVAGLSIGEAIAAGKCQVITSSEEIGRFEQGAILVTEMTDPDWVPIMKKAAGIITDSGGRTSHAAIVSRELGIAAIVGTGNGTEVLEDGQEITLSCAQGDKGFVYDGILDFERRRIDLSDMPEPRTRMMMNIASPAGAMRWWQLPCHGIGLARIEFIINNVIQIHPLALAHYDQIEDREVRSQIDELTHGYDRKTDYFVDHLARGIARIAASQFPDPVIVRMSDFKTNEYADLIGGRAYEPQESNPMLGFRGACRYYSDAYRDGFALECRAVKMAREQIGLSNVIVMIPFCRTVQEARKVLEVLAENGLERGRNGLQVYVMAEIPSNIILADQFAEYFDGFSIGSNDLTQLALGVDRDSDLLSHLFDERNEAVKRQILHLIDTAHQAGRTVGICGQAPSDYPEYADLLVNAGIDSISLNPDSVVATLKRVAQIESSKGFSNKGSSKGS